MNNDVLETMDNDVMEEVNEHNKAELRKTGIYIAVSSYISSSIFNHMVSELEMNDAALAFKHISAGVILEPRDTAELKQDVREGIIRHKALVAAINKADNDIDCSSSNFADGIRIQNTDEYPVIFTVEGLFLKEDDHYLYTNYENMERVEADRKGISVYLKEELYQCNIDETHKTDKRILRIKTIKGADYIMRPIRKTIEDIIAEFSEDATPEMTEYDSVEAVLERHLKFIPKSEYYPAYMVQNIEGGKAKKKFDKALRGYAKKIDADDAIAFIDTSLFGTGSDGIMFSKEGLAFDHMFKKVFLRYDEIDQLSLEGNKLIFIGNFSDITDDLWNTPIISSA